MKTRYPASTIARSRPDANRPDGKVIRSWRNTPPQRPPAISENVYTSGGFAKLSAGTHHAKPSSTISSPVRLSGRTRDAYSPVPTKLQITIGPSTAQATSASSRSLASTTATVAAPATSAARTMARVRPAVIGGSSPDRRGQASRAETDAGAARFSPAARAADAQNG